MLPNNWHFFKGCPRFLGHRCHLGTSTQICQFQGYLKKCVAVGSGLCSPQHLSSCSRVLDVSPGLLINHFSPPLGCLWNPFSLLLCCATYMASWICCPFRLKLCSWHSLPGEVTQGGVTQVTLQPWLLAVPC